MTTRAKFRCHKVTEFQEGPSEAHLLVVEDEAGANGEAGGFTASAPFGHLTIRTDNPNALVQFEVGREYFADFTACEVA